LARATPAAKIVGAPSHFRATGVAEFEAGCLSVFQALHMYSSSTRFGVSSCSPLFSYTDMETVPNLNRRQEGRLNRLTQLQAPCLAIDFNVRAMEKRRAKVVALRG
jgi:hypothetical protein